MRFGCFALLLLGSFIRAAAAQERVDLELVIAVDVSLSMDDEEQHLQRQGYADAFRSPDVMDAIRSGPAGKVAVAYLEWAGFGETRVLVDWTLIDGPEAAKAFADTLEAKPYSRIRRTSISSGLMAAQRLFGQRYQGLRRTIDVSGDGANNEGPLVAPVRDEIVAQGITINGLPLLLKRSPWSPFDMPDLDLYYEDCVIGGPGAFVIPVREIAQFHKAVRDKLLLEIAGLEPPPRLTPAADRERPPCDIGERQWERWMRGGYQ
jgi:hypothetical protein